MAYIYKIVNDINQKVYIGKTEFTIEKRFAEHCREAFKERNEKRPLYNAMRKYGIEHFHAEEVEQTDDPENREIYWIEYYRSFKNGYNATLGGDGKRYIDYDLVIATYKELGLMNKVAEKLGIDRGTVSKILHSNNIEIVSNKEIMTRRNGKITNMYNLQGEFLRSFPSTNEAARYMVENNLTNCKHTTIKQHITEVCTGRRKTAARFIWRYGEE